MELARGRQEIFVKKVPGDALNLEAPAGYWVEAWNIFFP